MTISSDPIPTGILLETAISAGKKAGAILLDYARSGFRIEHKNPINLVTDADHAAERCVIDHIRAHFPTHGFLAKNRGASTRHRLPTSGSLIRSTAPRILPMDTLPTACRSDLSIADDAYSA